MKVNMCGVGGREAEGKIMMSFFVKLFFFQVHMFMKVAILFLQPFGGANNKSVSFFVIGCVLSFYSLNLSFFLDFTCFLMLQDTLLPFLLLAHPPLPQMLNLS